MKHTYTTAPDESQRYHAELESYMQENVWREQGKPLCDHRDFCRSSCRAVRKTLYYGQLSHVGEHYALKRNDSEDFRVVVSALEEGSENEYVSMTDRTDAVEVKPGNLHMKGTLIALQLLFGLPCESEQTEMEIDGKPNAKILSAFSLPNFLLCSGRGDSSRGARTQTMIDKCAEHFHATLRILKPNILITLGGHPHEYFRAYHAVNVNVQAPDIHKITVDNKHQIFVLSLRHPSAGGYSWGDWGRSGVEEYVRPSIEKLLKAFDKGE